MVNLLVMETTVLGWIDNEHRRDRRRLGPVVAARFPQDHGHDRILIGFTTGPVRGQGALDGHVTDNITAHDDEISCNNMLPVKIAHNITDGR